MQNKKLELLKQNQDQIFLNISEILASLSSPVRIKLLHFLSQGPLTVEILSKKIDQSIANTSMHLRKMHHAKIVSVSIKGKNRLYTLHPQALSFWESCQDFIQAVNPNLRLEVESIYDDFNWNENLESTILMIKKKEVTLIDARPIDETLEDDEKNYVVHMPPNDIDKSLSQINKKKSALVFCRGRFCALSAHVVSELRKNGIDAYRLNESWYSLKRYL